MNPRHLFLLSLPVSAFLLAACGNKADLFLPPPPQEEGVSDPWEGQDPFEDDAVEAGPIGEPVGGEPVPPAPEPDDDE